MTRSFQKIISVLPFIFLCRASSHLKITKEKSWGLIKTWSRREAVSPCCSVFSSLKGIHWKLCWVCETLGAQLWAVLRRNECQADGAAQPAARGLLHAGTGNKMQAWPLDHWWQLGFLLPARDVSCVCKEEWVCCSLWVSPRDVSQWEQIQRDDAGWLWSLLENELDEFRTEKTGLRGYG